MGGAPCLLSLCMKAIGREIICGNGDLFPVIYDLPAELLELLLMRLPPLALLKLQEQRPFECLDDYESTYDCCNIGEKRGRCDIFEKAWRALFESRWPKLVTQIQPGIWLKKQKESTFQMTSSWQEKYWETHLQNCLDAVVEEALLPSYGGCLSDIRIPGHIIKSVGCDQNISSTFCNLSKLSCHCEQFGKYVKCLRLQNVLFCSELCQLLRSIKLESLVVFRIKSREHVDRLCELLKQSSNTILALEFLHCTFPSALMNKICRSLCIDCEEIPKLQHFSVRASAIFKPNTMSLPTGLVSLLSGRHLCSLTFSESRLGQHFAAAVCNTVLDASSSLSMLDFSDNYIGGWLSMCNWKCPSDLSSSIGMSRCLPSLCVLNLRGNNLRSFDVDRLKDFLFCVPNLETLDLSDNLIEDDGIKNLFPYIVEAGNSHLADLRLENCGLTSEGVTELLEILSTFKKPLYSLSLADNDIGSHIAAPLGKFFSNFVKEINIKDNDLCSTGFLELQKAATEAMKLVRINLSNNRGGIEAANFLSKLLLCAPDLVEVNVACNLMPAECMTNIYSALENAKGKLQCLDLRGNFYHCQPGDVSRFFKFQHNGIPIVLVSALPTPAAPYDDDP